ncbi:MFS family permease [Natronocella acetinitrilica]|uniref:MFS family permease n=1 Tax=Natronocella acetinitrilica TaxID=414046 RepID=A0AAE3G0X5_9GAMM|nr:MFS family permease [Natronocella acetinitrilica]
MTDRTGTTVAANPAPYRNIALLALAQAMLMSGTSVLIATSALVGRALADNPALATIPLGLQFMAMTAAAIPASLFMGRYGRRPGFLIGVSLGLLGTLLAGLAVWSQSFALFCVAAVLIGVYNGSGQFYRFAAADVAPVERRARAISLVLAGGIVAGFMGPNLAAWTRTLLGPDFTASYLVLAGLYLVGMAAISALRIPLPPKQVLNDPGRPLRQIAAQPTFMVALAAATVGYGVMNLLMVATPLSMEAHDHAFDDAAFVIQWHVLAMFVPSFFTGELVRRFGLLTVLGTGVVLMLACVAVHFSGHGVWHYWSGLVLLGVGWNFLFIGGTTLLTEAYAESEKARSQAFNDFVVFGTVTLTALGSGALLSTFGWVLLNLMVVPFLIAVLVGLLWLHRLRRRQLQEA